MSVSLRGTPKRSTARRLTAKRAAERRFLLAASAATVGIQRGDQPAALLRECLDSHTRGMGGKASHVGKSFLIRFEIVCDRATTGQGLMSSRRYVEI